MSLPNEPRRVLVLGANGRLGRAAVQAFADAGWQVIAHLRRAARAPLPPGVQTVQADALDVATLSRAAQGVQVIVHALNPPYTDWARRLPPLTDAVLRVAEASGALLMLPGNVYNFGRALPPLLREDTPFVADHAKAAQRIALEAALAASPVRSVVIRAGDFLGDEGSWLDLVIARDLARGRLTHLGPDDLLHAWAWLPDLARCFVRVAEAALDRPGALPRHAVLHHAGLALTGAQLHAAIEAACGRPLARRDFPWTLLALAAPLWPMARALRAMRYLWQRPHRLDDTRLRALIGEPPATPLATVLREALAPLGGPGGVQNRSSKRSEAVV